MKHHEVTLSHRQREIVRLISLGQEVKQIAAALGISEFTVVSHLRISVRKLKAINRPNLVRIFLLKNN